ncbi:hypothetical protein [Streptomyces albidoflavus]|uniref:hypothetical protein n=1 Tax=Streptomyces albidoflavus TaxID=1886 RepID=UPI0033A6B35F
MSVEQLVPTAATRKLQILVAICSLVFAAGSALHNFAVVDTQLIEEMMRMAGGANPEAAAPGFTTGFRVIGTVYVIGNALGVLALWSRARLLWWLVLAVNATQALGFAVIPGEMWTGASDRYGVAGVLPSVITDGGAVILTLVLLAALVKYRTVWAQRRLERA